MAKVLFALAVWSVLGCDHVDMRDVIRNHDPAQYTGDYARASKLGIRGPTRPALFYLRYVTAGTGVAVRNIYDGPDDESHPLQSWLPYSLDKALSPSVVPRGAVQLRPLFPDSQHFEARQRRVLDRLAQIFKGLHVYFTTDDPTDLLFAEDVQYATIIIAQYREDLFGQPVSLSTYSEWDPGNQRQQEVSFVFDNFQLDDDALGYDIAHAVGHMLGLEDVDSTTAIMRNAVLHKGGWEKARIHDEFTTYVEGRPGISSLEKELAAHPMPATVQDDLGLLRAAVGTLTSPMLIDSDFIVSNYIGDVPDAAIPPEHGLFAAGSTCMPQGVVDGAFMFTCAEEINGAVNVSATYVPISDYHGGGSNGTYAFYGDGGGGGGGGGGGSGHPPKPKNLPTKVVDKTPTPPDTPQKQRKRGECRVAEYRKLAREKFKGYRSVFKKGQQLKDHETNCANFVVDYLKAVLGHDVPQAAKDMINNNDYKKYGNLDKLVANSDTHIRGPEVALLITGTGTPIDGLANALPGDVMQLWTKNQKGHWKGHQGVISFVGRTDNIDGTHSYMLGLMGAHQGDIGGDQIYEVDAQYMEKGTSPADRSRTFIARPNQSSDGVCPE